MCAHIKKEGCSVTIACHTKLQSESHCCDACIENPPLLIGAESKAGNSHKDLIFKYLFQIA